MHQTIPEQGHWLKQVVTGHFAYYAIPTNSRALSAFRHYVTDFWRRTLRRRSQKDGFTWDRMTKLRFCARSTLPLAKCASGLRGDAARACSASVFARAMSAAAESVMLSSTRPASQYASKLCALTDRGSRTDEAILWLERARGANPLHPLSHAYLASAYALRGETERAAAELAEARKLSDGRYSSVACLKAAQYFGVPKVRALFEATYFAGLRKAGMPEE